jgi:hypothetical protein
MTSLIAACTATKIKIMGEPFFSIYRFMVWYSCLMRLSSEKYEIVSWKKNDFEDLNDLLVSFRFCFVIAEDSSCIYLLR